MTQVDQPKTMPRIIAILLLVGLLLAAILISRTAHAQDIVPSEPANGEATKASVVFLPLVSRSDAANGTLGNFTPKSAMVLTGGQYDAASLIIPTGVTVTLSGDVLINVTGSVTIDGALVGDCFAITIYSDAGLIVTGVIDNRCSNPDNTPGALTLVTKSDTLQIGTLEKPAIIESSGDVEISNAPGVADWEFEITAAQRSTSKLTPVCSAMADTVLANTLPDAPANVRFYGNALDPDGGPVTFRWDFGDDSSSTEQNPRYEYTKADAFTVTLTVSDDEGQTCQATLGVNIDDGSSEGLSNSPAVAIEPGDLAIAVGEDAAINILFADSQDEETVLIYDWDFGDGTTSTVMTPTHSYAAPGRYEVRVSVADPTTFTRTASASIYVFAQDSSDIASAAVDQPNAVCPPNRPPVGAVFINGGAINNPPKAGPGRKGANRRYRWRGDVIVAPGLNIRAGDGGDGRDVVGNPTAFAQNGGDGGSLDILVAGRVTFCGGITLAAGDGGKGGEATATAPSGKTAVARAGKGGDAGDHIRVLASVSIIFEGAVTVDPGSGGDGGNANATGDAGKNGCPAAEVGADADATGGNGGRASKFAWVRGAVFGVNNVTIINGLGGFGGDSSAKGGKGGDAICPSKATGGSGGKATSRGGKGGDARLTGAINAGWTINPAAFSAGFGGTGEAIGGNGGSGTATPAKACESTTATGGNAGRAFGFGGDGGVGRHRGFGGEGLATGGTGGQASASGGDCTECKAGGSASATGGQGGDATARVGNPKPLGDTTNAVAGDGGPAATAGGRGGDCKDCPAGAGGNGGGANANGGAGGNAFGSGKRTGGDGGTGTATGGHAGKGADCCKPEPAKAGGNGGTGGNATGNSGKGGLPGGKTPANGNKAGNGGNGGEGDGPGTGGAGGIGAGSPFKVLDGIKGVDGKKCEPTPTPTATNTPTPTHIPTPTGTSTPTGTVIPTGTVTVTPECVATAMPASNNAVPVPCTATPVPTTTTTGMPTATCVSVPTGNANTVPVCETEVATPVPSATVTITPITETPTPTITVTVPVTVTVTVTAVATKVE